MSAESSPETAKRYGLQRVCRVLDVPRSTLYTRRARAKVVPLHPKRRGPKPTMSDEALLEAIRADLAASPFLGEATARCGRGCASCARYGARACGCCA